MPALMQDLSVGVGEKSGRRGAEARAKLETVEWRLTEHAEARILPAFGGTVGELPAQRTALKILVDASGRKAVEAREGALEARRIDPKLAGEICDRVGALDRGRHRGA